MMRYCILAVSIIGSLHAAPYNPEVMPRGIQTVANLTLISDDFKNTGSIPVKCTCDGINKAPLLRWSGAARTVQEFALICEDPDAPGKEPFVHWIVYNIPLTANGLLTDLKQLPVALDGTKQGTNSFGNIGYNGPCPPKGDKPHHYIFTLYSLEQKLNLAQGATKQQLLQAIQNQTTPQQTTQLMGTYQRK